MINALEYARDNDVSAVIFNGDTVDVGIQENYDYLDAILTEAFGEPFAEGMPKLFFNLGNHELYPTSLCAGQECGYFTEEARFKAFVAKWSDPIEDNVFVREINGVSYVFAYPSADETYIADADVYLNEIKIASKGDTLYRAPGGGFSTGDIAKIKAALDEIVASGTDKPIFFFTHFLLGETYGDGVFALDEPYKSRLSGILDDYPQLVHITGHSHFTSLHDRSIAQDDYTSINVGLFSYGCYVTGVDEDINGATISYDNVTERYLLTSDPVSKKLDTDKYFGILLGFDTDALKVGRVDLYEGKVQSRAWRIPYGITELNKSDKFYYEDGDRTGDTLHFGVDTALVGHLDSSGNLVAVSFRDVDEYRACEGYEIVIKNGGGTQLKKVLWQSRYWAALDEKSSYYIPLDVAYSASYTIELRAINFFGGYSAKYTDASIVIDLHPDKDILLGGVNYEYNVDLDAYSTVTFSYKITNGGKFNACILDSGWSNFYGYFTFNKNGTTADYSGVVCSLPDSDGFITVTITLSSVTKYMGTKPDKVMKLFIRGSTSDADGFISDVTFE